MQWHCKVSIGTISALGLLLYAFQRTRTIARRLPYGSMFGPTIIAASSALYYDARLPTEFRDKRSVVGVLERVLPEAVEHMPT